MATYKLTYKWGDNTRVVTVDEVQNENIAVMVGDSINKDIPREASVKVEFICE